MNSVGMVTKCQPNSLQEVVLYNPWNAATIGLVAMTASKRLRSQWHLQCGYASQGMTHVPCCKAGLCRISSCCSDWVQYKSWELFTSKSFHLEFVGQGQLWQTGIEKLAGRYSPGSNYAYYNPSFKIPTSPMLSQIPKTALAKIPHIHHHVPSTCFSCLTPSHWTSPVLAA